MHIFDYSFLDEGLLPAEIVNLTATITAFNAISDTRKESNKSIYTELEKIARDNTKINKLLLIPCVILDFLCIHPFSDGNGRVSRLLSLFLLYKSGYDVGKYVSFEEQINESKDFYYEALQESSIGWHTNENSYFEYMKNFLSLLYKCCLLYTSPSPRDA